jgi:hypothetical protein
LRNALQTLLALIAIFVIKRFMPFDAGLRWPREKRIRPAILWGFLRRADDGRGLCAQPIAHHLMDLGYAVTPRSMAGWLFFEGIYVGPTEEILFRSLLVGYLCGNAGKIRSAATTWLGRRYRGVIFALAHATNHQPSGRAAAGQQVTPRLGILYAYWFEKSRS